jgi:hypothetical protein
MLSVVVITIRRLQYHSVTPLNLPSISHYDILSTIPHTPNKNVSHVLRAGTLIPHTTNFLYNVLH